MVYDQFADRWLLSQFTTRGLDDRRAVLQLRRDLADRRPDRRVLPLRVHHQEDRDGGFFFPDYPKYGVWKDSYVITTRDFGPLVEYGISVYALERTR